MRDGVDAVETVSLRTDRELAAFVTRLLHLFENPARRDDLRTGRLRFRLAPGGAAGASVRRPSRRVEQGRGHRGGGPRRGAGRGPAGAGPARGAHPAGPRPGPGDAGVEIEKER